MSKSGVWYTAGIVLILISLNLSPSAHFNIFANFEWFGFVLASFSFYKGVSESKKEKALFLQNNQANNTTSAIRESFGGLALLGVATIFFAFGIPFFGGWGYMYGIVLFGLGMIPLVLGLMRMGGKNSPKWWRILRIIIAVLLLLGFSGYVVVLFTGISPFWETNEERMQKRIEDGWSIPIIYL